MAQLTGSELLAKVKELGDVSKSELVRGCGYVSSKKDGTERLNFTAFYEALLEAKGTTIGEKAKTGPGRKLSYLTTILAKGHAVIGQGYVSQIGGGPDDQLKIEVKRGRIVLSVAGDTDEDDKTEQDGATDAAGSTEPAQSQACSVA
jgi:hypothetical protein